MLAAAVLGGSCRPDAPAGDATGGEPPLEAQEVAAPPDAAHDPSADPQETRRSADRLGVLPGDYPADLPVPSASSLVDYGDGEDGARFVELHTTTAPPAVRAELEAAWEDAGWQRRNGSYAKGDTTAALTVEAVSPTLTRVEIVWRRGG